MTTVDWSWPIEAVHEDGRVEAMTVAARDSSHWRTRESPRDGQSNVYWNDDGSDPCGRSGWTIRNTLTTDLDGWDLAEARRLIREQGYAADYEPDEPDSILSVALTCIRRGRQLEREGR